MFDERLFAKKLSGLTPYNVDTAKYRVRLDANESFIQLPEELRRELKECVESFEFNRYPDPDAVMLKKAFCSFYGGVDQASVGVGNGSDEIISLLMNCFLDYGSAVMTFSPDFSMYGFYASLAGARVVECPKREGDLQIDFDLALKLIKENGVKLCIFSNPCNPTGKIESKDDIKSLARLCPETIFVSDEAYMDFSRRDESFMRETREYPNIIVLKTLSKALGCAALRLGFVVADESFAKMFSAVKSPYNVNGISQSFGRAALEKKELLCGFTERIKQSVTDLSQGLRAVGLFEFDETYTNFVFARDGRAEEIWSFLKQNGILVRKFSVYGGALRITAGSADENAAVFKALSEFKSYAEG